MLLFTTVLVTSLATAGGWKLTLEAPPVIAIEPASGGLELPGQDEPRSLASVPGCSSLLASVAAWCAHSGSAAPLAPTLGRQALAWRADLAAPLDAERESGTAAPARGGFLHLDLLAARHFGAGPEVGWVAPDAPQENLLRQRLVTPGIGVWYSALPSRLFLGISANTWLSTLGETWFVNALSSQARVGFAL